MKITNAFIIRLLKMPEPKRAQFIHDNIDHIDFINLNNKLREMATEALMKDENGLADKMISIREDIGLYESRQRKPAAISPIELVVNPCPMTVM